jgi:hypothetical protein
MKHLRRLSAALPLAGLILLAACADPPQPTGGGSGPSTPSSDQRSARLDVYEALIRHLVDPNGTQPIFVLTELCFQLIEGEMTCPDRLDRVEQRALGERLQDLGQIVFLPNDDPGPPPDEPFQEILLGPIVDRPDGLRVEGGSVCGGVCGSGAVYIVLATENGYEVKGTDDAYGSWIA